MALPVVTVAAGGMPVVDVTSVAPLRGMPITEAANGRGRAVTKVAAGGMPVQYAYIGGDVAPFATFNPASASNMTLSNGNLTATHLSSAAPAGALTATFKNTGKYYFEFLFVSLGTNGSSVCVGFLSSTGSIVEDASVSPNSVAVFFGGASFLYANGVTTGKDFGNRVVNDRWGIAVDLGARLCWFRKNGGLWNIDASANPATGVNGVPFAAGSYSPWIRYPSAISGEVMTANFGATAYGNAAPAGFGNW